MRKNLKKSLLLSLGLLIFSISTSLADTNVSRIAGIDRYETALKVNQKYFTKADGELAVIVSGNNFKYPLYGSYMASTLKVPLIVVENSSLSSNNLRELKRLNIKRAFIVSDYKLLNSKIDNSLKNNGITVRRFYDTTYKTGLIERISSVGDKIENVLSDTFPYTDLSGDMLINENKFPDLLSSIPLASNFKRTYGSRFIDPTFFPFLGDRPQLIFGGTESVEYSAGTLSTARLFGTDRYETAVQIANYCVTLGDSTSYIEFESGYRKYFNFPKIKTAVIVDGTNYPDALSSGIVATFTDGAVLLTEPNILNQDTKKFIQENNIKNIVIVGGEKSVSKAVEDELRRL